MEIITGKTGVPHVYAADDAELYKLFLGDGAYVLPTGNRLTATLDGASKVRITDGSIIVQGRLAKIRQSTGFQELNLAPGVIGQKRVDLVVAEYRKEQETPIDAWIVGETPLAIDWLSGTEGGVALIPEKGQLYKLNNTVAPYEANTYYRWMGNAFARSFVQDLEHLDLKIVQGAYNTSAYIEPALVTGNIDNGEIHQVKLWAIRFNGLAPEENPVDYRVFLTNTPYNTLIATTLQMKTQAENLLQDALQQVGEFATDISQSVLTGKVLYSKAEKLSDIQSGNDLEFAIDGMSYSPQAGDTIELYINGLKTNNMADGYTMTVENNTVTFTFETARNYSSGDYGEIVIRR